MKNKVIYFLNPNSVAICEESPPTPKAGELLIENTRTLISTGTEGIVLAKDYSPGTSFDRWVKYPFRAGYLNAGRVVRVGRGVAGWKNGDRVAARRGHAAYVVSEASEAVHIPDNVPDNDAAWMGLGKIVQIAVRAAKHQLGDTVAVIGLGLLGQLVCQYLRLLGARTIIAIDTSPLRLEFAKNSGATHVLQMTSDQALEQIQALTGGRGADVVYDVTGNFRVLPTALPLARDFGTIVMLGTTGTPEKQTLTDDIIKRGLHIVGAHEANPPKVSLDPTVWTSHRMHELFLHYLSTRQIIVDQLVTHRFSPGEARRAYDLLQKNRDAVMGILFEWK